MTPERFIDALFGDWWTPEQLPVLLEMVRQAQEDAKRYHELKDAIAREDDWIASRSSLVSIDEQVDAARFSGLI